MKLFYDCSKKYFIFRKQQLTNMCWVNNCCGYFKLRTGCISISVVNILLALAFLVLVLVVGRQSQYGSLYGERCSVPLYMVFPGTIVTIALWILLLIGVLKLSLALVIILLFATVFILRCKLLELSSFHLLVWFCLSARHTV